MGKPEWRVSSDIIILPKCEAQIRQKHLDESIHCLVMGFNNSSAFQNIWLPKTDWQKFECVHNCICTLHALNISNLRKYAHAQLAAKQVYFWFFAVHDETIHWPRESASWDETSLSLGTHVQLVEHIRNPSQQTPQSPISPFFQRHHELGQIVRIFPQQRQKHGGLR